MAVAHGFIRIEITEGKKSERGAPLAIGRSVETNPVASRFRLTDRLLAQSVTYSLRQLRAQAGAAIVTRFL